MTIEYRRTAEGERRLHGRVEGDEAACFQAQGYRVVVYTKDDIWYNDPSPGMTLALDSECRWQSTGINRGTQYAAFLVASGYHQPTTIASQTASHECPLQVDGKTVVCWNHTHGEAAESDLPETDACGRAVRWLQKQIPPNDIVPNPEPSRRGLIIGYRIPQSHEYFDKLAFRSWCYDNASAAIALVCVGHSAAALHIFNGLKAVIEADGRLGFSYNTHNDWIHADYQSGAIAWIGYACAFYQQQTGDTQCLPTAIRIAGYLMDLQNIDTASRSFGAIRISPEVSFYPTYDNIVAFFFLRTLGRLTGEALYYERARLLREALYHRHWNPVFGRFDRAIGDDNNIPIEVNALGGLFLLATGDTLRARSCLDFIETTYQPVLGSAASGYAPYDDRSTVYPRGSLQVSLFCYRLGMFQKSAAIVREIVKLQDTEGGVLFASPDTIVKTGEEFRTWPSVAGSSWLVIALCNNEDFWGA